MFKLLHQQVMSLQHFGPCLFCPNGCMDQDAIAMEVGLGPGHIVLDGDPAPPPKRGQSPQFSARVYYGQTAAWIKMPFSAVVGLGPGNIVLDAGPAPPQGAQPPNFGPCLLWPKGWMNQDATSYEGRPRPRLHCVTWGPSSPSQKGHSPPIFRPCLLWPNGRPSQLLLSTCNTAQSSVVGHARTCPFR